MRPDPHTVEQARRALRVLADLAPTGAAAADEKWCVPLDWFQWLDRSNRALAKPPLAHRFEDGYYRPVGRSAKVAGAYGQQLAMFQQVRGGAGIRVGYFWIAGSIATAPDRYERVFFPLVSRTLRLKSARSLTFQADTEDELTELIVDLDARATLEPAMPSLFDDIGLLWQMTSVRNWLDDAARAAGFPKPTYTDLEYIPDQHVGATKTHVIARGAIYSRGAERASRAMQTFQDFATKLWDTHTAFHSLYGAAPSAPLSNVKNDSFAEHPGGSAADRVFAAGPLTTRQRAIVEAARTEPITVVNGAPGTGKSHTLVAIVTDAIRRGESVLVAARSDASVEALAALFREHPGVEPIMFGSGERRRELSHRLQSLSLLSTPIVEEAQHAFGHAVRLRNEQRARVSASLVPDAQRSGLLAPGDAAARELARRANPSDLTEIRLLMLRLGESSPWGRLRRGSQLRRLRALLGADGSTPEVTLFAAVRLLDARHVDDDVTPAELTENLIERNIAAERAFARALSTVLRSEDRFNRAGTQAVAAVGVALRSGPQARRAQLANLTDTSLTQALPLWLGDLGDVDQILPPVPDLFDLVLVDEAASTEQRHGAAALLRGARAVIVGDPRQLRPVSFLADDTIAQAHDAAGVEGADRSILDLRRNSLFDAAAAASVPHVLDEHFRSAPHLIDIVARDLYAGTVQVATRTPLTEQLDCVHLIDVRERTTKPITRTPAGAVAVEVDIVMEELRRRQRFGVTSVGVLTPFRAQADAIQDAVMDAFTPEMVVAMDLRIGTVHEFQGMERDDVILSLALVDDDRGGWRFVSNPNLIAVMLTRARNTMTIVASCTPDVSTALGRYIEHADVPPGPPTPVGPTSAWTQRVADGLVLGGMTVELSYPCGRHVIDIATVSNGRPLAVICELHPGGIDAHVDRHVELMRLGWRVRDALPALCDDNPAGVIVEIVAGAANEIFEPPISG